MATLPCDLRNCFIISLCAENEVLWCGHTAIIFIRLFGIVGTPLAVVLCFQDRAKMRNKT